MPKIKKSIEDCPPQVVALVEHLKSTGTGPSKLAKLIAWGIECKEDGSGAEGFLAKARTLTTGTVEKIEAYLKTHAAPQAGAKEVAESVKGKLEEIKSSKEAPEASTSPSSESETKEASTVKEEDKPSPVADMKVHEAIDKISRMTSVNHLEEIVLLDSRVTVQRAATERIEELKKAADAPKG